MPLVFTHGRTSKALLEIDWDHPVYVPPTEDGEQTRSPVAPVLSFADALAYIAGKDSRPLIVLRECLNCQGTDLALLSQTLRNERTLLLTRWFHCVKLPPQVALKDHPLNALFPEHSHVFLCSADGKRRIDFDGEQPQSSLVKAMTGLLRDSYDRDPETSVKELLRILTQFDRIEEQEALHLKDLDQELEQRGARSPKVARLRAELEKLGKEKAELVQRQKELSDLGLKGEGAAGAGG